MIRVILLTWLFISFAGLQAAELTLEDFARPSQFLQIQISPSGKYLAATSRNDEGTILLNVIDVASNQIISIRHFEGTDSIGSFNWANNERIIINLVRDIGSLEQPVPTGEIFAVNADGSNPQMLTGYRARYEKDGAQIIDYLSGDDKFVMIATATPNVRGSFTLIKRMNVDTGRTRQVARAPMRSAGMALDRDGVARIAVGIDQNNDNEMIMMYRKNERSDWTVLRRYGQRDGSFTPLSFLPDNKRILGLSDTQTDTKAISILDPETGKEELLAHHPQVDVMPIFSIENGYINEVIGASYEYDTFEDVFFADVEDKTFSGFAQGLRAAFPGKKINLSSATRDNSIIVISARSANHPPEFYLFDTRNQQLSFLLNGRPWLKPELLSQTSAIIYKSRDGLDIHAILTLPIGKEPKNLPLILLPHGGPHGIRDYLEIDTDAKVLAQHGYAVLQPNFRGSGGFGRSFLQMGFLNWGTTMIDDMTDGVKYLISKGIADADRLCVYGASYGGYASLMSVVREPDLYKCAVNFVGMSDLNLMYEHGDTTESQVGLNILEMYIGRDKERLDAQSAIKNLDKLKAPIFIIHGARDRRVPLIQAEVLRDELKKRDHPYEWLVKEREGHGFYKPEHNVERWQKMLAFIDKYIGETEKN